MEPIASGTTTERVLRTIVLTVLFVGYSGWSFVDGYYTYPEKNVVQLMQNLSPVPKVPPPVNRRVTQAAAESLADKSEAEVLALLGDPAGVTPLTDDAGRPSGQLNNYIGPGGMAHIHIQDGRVAPKGILWRPGSHTESDLFFQLVIGGVTGGLGLLMIVLLLRVLFTRIELTDQGLIVGSQGGWRFGSSPLIPFESMTGLRDPKNRFADRRSDYLELEYTLSDGISGQVQINKYVHAAFDKVVTEICRRKDFDNPLGRHDPPENDASTDPAPEQPATDSESQSQA